MLIEGMEQTLHVRVGNSPDLTKAQKILVLMSFSHVEKEYTPEIISADECIFIIPYEDAMLLRSEACVLAQVVGLDEYGNNFWSNSVKLNVRRLNRREGFNERTQS